jgi:hypothetical protein
MSAARIQDILRNDARLGRLAKQAEKLAAVEKALRRELPDALAQVVSVCNLRDGHLIIAAHDGPAAAKLRQLVQTLADRLRAQVPEITAIHVKVQASSPFNPLHRKHISLGESAGEALMQLAGELPASDLKRAVLRLGKRAQPPSKD